MKLENLQKLSIKDFKEAKPTEEDLPKILLTKTHTIDTQVKAVGTPEDRILQAILSTEAIDSMNDTISIKGWNTKWFKKQGTILWAHESRMPPIGKPQEVWVNPDRTALMGTAKMTPADMNHPHGMGFGHTIYRMYAEGYLKNISVGFQPTKFEWSDEEGRSGGIDFQKQILKEWSPVPIGANPDAHGEAVSKGIDLEPLFRWAELKMDTKDYVGFERQDLEDYYQIIKEYKPKVSVPKSEEEKLLDDNAEVVEPVVEPIVEPVATPEPQDLEIPDQDAPQTPTEPMDESQPVEEDETPDDPSEIPAQGAADENEIPEELEEIDDEEEEELEEEETGEGDSKTDPEPPSEAPELPLDESTPAPKALTFLEIKALYAATETAHVDSLVEILDSLELEKLSPQNRDKLTGAFEKFQLSITTPGPSDEDLKRKEESDLLDTILDELDTLKASVKKTKSEPTLEELLQELDLEKSITRVIDGINGKLPE